MVGPCSVDDLRSCAVTSKVMTGPLFPVLDIIETEDNKILLPHMDRSRFRRRNYVKEVMSLWLVSQPRCH